MKHPSDYYALNTKSESITKLEQDSNPFEPGTVLNKAKKRD